MTTVSTVVVLVGIVVGVLIRVWLLFHLPLFGDSAVVGLMARQIEEGHFSVFYWGQNYGGVEPYVVATVFEVFGANPLSLSATASLLAASSSVVLAAAAYEVGRDMRLAVLSGVLLWVWPYPALWNSVHEFGFRGVTLLCGLLLLLACLRIYRKKAGGWTYVLVGLSAGLGWWASPEIAYFAVPAAVVLLLGWKRVLPGARRRRQVFDPAPGALVVVGGLLGSAPWWYANFHSGFASLKTSSAGIARAPSYLTRLGVFFSHALPVELGLRYMWSGNWLGGTGFGLSVYVVIAVVVTALVVRGLLAVRNGRDGAVRCALALGLVEFPFLYAAIPGSAYWLDGRYGVYLAPLMVLFLVAVFSDESQGRIVLDEPGTGSVDLLTTASSQSGFDGNPNTNPKWTVASAVVIAGLVLSLNAAVVTSGVSISSPRAFFSGWSDPNAQARTVVVAMQANGIHYAYGDYWTAYVLDFLASGKTVVSPSPMDVNRSIAIEDEVASSHDPAWLFYAPNHPGDGPGSAAAAFSNPEPGPGGYTLARFIALVKSQGVAYRTVDLGVLVAVVPEGAVKVP